MSADWEGGAPTLALSRIPELGHVDYCQGERVDDTSVRGWNYTTHAGSKAETRAWLRRLGLIPEVPHA